jgi:hypothetical protein
MEQLGSSLWQLSIALLLGMSWEAVSMAQSPPTDVSDSPCSSSWTVVKSPDGPSTSSNFLNGVSASATNNVWAVGGYELPSSARELTERWDGTAWKVIPSAHIGSSDLFHGVAAISATDVWAVGEFDAHPTSPQAAFIEQWNGKKWSLVPSPTPGQLSLLLSVKAVSANDVWTAGFYYDNSGNSKGLLEHWNGKKWIQVPSANPGLSNNELHGFAVVSTNDWVVGAQSSDGGISYQTLIEHWDGTQWSDVPSPSPGSSNNDLQGVTAVGANDVWTVGLYSNTGVDQTLAEHWDGTSWTVVATPDIDPAGNDLSDVSARATSDVWAVGSHFKSGVAQTLVEQWDGTQWRIVPSPNPGKQEDQLAKMTKISNTLWSVGHFAKSNVGHTLVEAFCR